MRFLLLLLLAAGLSTAQPAASPGIDRTRLDSIAARLKPYADRGQLSGIVTLVMHRGEIVHQAAVGFQNVEDKKPMATDSIFQVMSMTKPVTGVAVMMLAEQGKLSLQDPVEMHLPEFKGQMVKLADGSTHKPARLVTIRDLMSHTSGMSGLPPASTPDLYQKMNLTLEEAVRVFAQQPLEFNPGSRWMYSNPGIATLGRLVEVHGGMPFERFIEERIFKPLGMKDSHIFLPAAKHARLALVYRVSGGKLVRSPSSILGGDAGAYRQGAKFSAPEFGLYSTAPDLARFYQMMLNGGVLEGQRLLSRASVQTMTSVHTGALKAGHNPGTGFGLTWEVVKEPAGMLTMRGIGSYGHGGAFGTHGWIDPAKNLVGVFLIQSTGGGSGGEARDAFMTMAGSAVLD